MDNNYTKLVDEVFTDGWFMYFQTTYGVDDKQINEDMMEEIEKKIKLLKKNLEKSRIKGFAQGYEQACRENNFGIKTTHKKGEENER